MNALVKVYAPLPMHLAFLTNIALSQTELRVTEVLQSLPKSGRK